MVAASRGLLECDDSDFCVWGRVRGRWLIVIHTETARVDLLGVLRLMTAVGTQFDR